MPPNSSAYLVEFADALLAVQDRKGMWHTLPCLPHAESYPEVSGTGMIARYLAIAIRNGFLQGAQYRRAVRNALRGLETYRTPDGIGQPYLAGPGSAAIGGGVQTTGRDR
jgi:rhamnogalacturonyl hydrolase YesR